MQFYDWNKTRSFDAIVTMVVGPRGLGKTYGMRKAAIKDYLKNGHTFVELTRYQDELKTIEPGYFDRVSTEFPEYDFKTESGYGYISRKSDNKPEWERICYFSALTAMQKDKKRTFDNVGAIIFDEFLIDRKLNPYNRYLPNEVDSLYNAYSTFSREVPGVPNPARIYLLGNATDLANPYFIRWGVEKLPEINTYRWFNGKTVLLHYCAPTEYAENVFTMTNIGRLTAGEEQARLMYESRFSDDNAAFVCRRPSRSRYDSSVTFLGIEFGLWRDEFTDTYFVSFDVPRNSENRYVLTKSDLDESKNYATKNGEFVRSLQNLFVEKRLRFESATIKALYFDFVGVIGIR